MTENDISTKEPELRQEVNPSPTLQEAKESEIDEHPPTQDSAPDAAAVSDSPANEDETFTGESVLLDLCPEDVYELSPGYSEYRKSDSYDIRWRWCHLDDKEVDKIKFIIAKAHDVAMEKVWFHGSTSAYGPWLSSSYLYGEYSVANKDLTPFVIDMNSQTMLSPSKESVAEIFRALNVLSDDPEPLPAEAFAELLYWGMNDVYKRPSDFERYPHRRGICIELKLSGPYRGRGIPPPIVATPTFLITKDYNIEVLPNCSVMGEWVSSPAGPALEERN